MEARRSAPAGTSAAIIERLNAAFLRALADPQLRSKMLNEGGMEPAGGTPDAFWSQVKRDTATYAKLVKQSGIQPE